MGWCSGAGSELYAVRGKVSGVSGWMGDGRFLMLTELEQP